MDSIQFGAQCNYLLTMESRSSAGADHVATRPASFSGVAIVMAEGALWAIAEIISGTSAGSRRADRGAGSGCPGAGHGIR